MQFHLNLLIHLCKVHFNQFFRLLAEIGIARIIILSIIGLIFLFQFLPLIPFSSIWLFVLPLLPAILFKSLFSSKSVEIPTEKDFILQLQANPYWTRFNRNLLFALPLIFILLYWGNYKAIGISIPFLVILSLDIRLGFQIKKAVNLNIPQSALLPWTVAIRRGVVFYVIILILALLQMIHVSFLFIAMFVLHLSVLNLLQNNETQLQLQSYNKKSRGLLTIYLREHLIYYALAQMPLLILTAILNTELIFVVMGIFLLLTIHQWLSIYLKFSFYEEGKDNSDMQSIQTIMLAFLLIPFTIPIPFFYLWRYRNKAIDNLKHYL